jgi:hypothetical protein
LGSSWEGSSLTPIPSALLPWASPSCSLTAPAFPSGPWVPNSTWTRVPLVVAGTGGPTQPSLTLKAANWGEERKHRLGRRAWVFLPTWGQELLEGSCGAHWACWDRQALGVIGASLGFFQGVREAGQSPSRGLPMTSGISSKPTSGCEREAELSLGFCPSFCCMTFGAREGCSTSS